MSGFNMPPGVSPSDIPGNRRDEPCRHSRMPEECDACYIASLEEEVSDLNALVRDTTFKLRTVQTEPMSLPAREALAAAIKQLRNGRVS